MGLDDLPTLLEKWPHSREKWLGKYSHPTEHLGYDSTLQLLLHIDCPCFCWPKMNLSFQTFPRLTGSKSSK